MKTELKAKLLLYFFQPNNNQGFTKLGLLFRLFLYGTAVTALSFPFYIVPCKSCHQNLYQMTSQIKGKQAEAKQAVSLINKAQQAYFAEIGVFVKSSDEAAWSNLGISIRTEKDIDSFRKIYYHYVIQPLDLSNVSFQKKDGKIMPDDYVMVIAEPLEPGFKSYVGIVARYVGIVASDRKNYPDTDTSFQSIVCESKEAGVVKPIIMPNVPDSGWEEVPCPEGFEPTK